jgi:hypothetical protein
VAFARPLGASGFISGLIAGRGRGSAVTRHPDRDFVWRKPRPLAAAARGCADHDQHLRLPFAGHIEHLGDRVWTE